MNNYRAETIELLKKIKLLSRSPEYKGQFQYSSDKNSKKISAMVLLDACIIDFDVLGTHDPSKINDNCQIKMYVNDESNVRSPIIPCGVVEKITQSLDTMEMFGAASRKVESAYNSLNLASRRSALKDCRKDVRDELVKLAKEITFLNSLVSGHILENDASLFKVRIQPIYVMENEEANKRHLDNMHEEANQNHYGRTSYILAMAKYIVSGETEIGVIPEVAQVWKEKMDKYFADPENVKIANEILKNFRAAIAKDIRFQKYFAQVGKSNVIS